MTPEELLKPRYEVIADYPDNIFKIGSIIDGYSGKSVLCAEDWIWYVSKYPHIFKPLQWWEKREYIQLPNYIKNYVVVIKIAVGSDMSKCGSAWMFEKSPDGLRHRVDLRYYEPATEIQYTEYITTNP